MIDTIALTLNQDQYKIFDHSRFRSTDYIGKNSFTKKVYNPDFNKEGYKPRITLYNRFGTEQIRIEFSAPKILFGNNFDELDESDFDNLVAKLYNNLWEMKIRAYPDDLKKANVSKIDYSKNFVLGNGVKTWQILNELSKVDLTRSSDIEEVKYRNKGHCLHLKHTNSLDFAVYDKWADLVKAKISDKRSIEKDNKLQLNLLDLIEDTNKLEIIRIEARLVDRQKIKDILKLFSFNDDLTFQGLFKKHIARAVLGKYWHEIADGLDIANIRDYEEIDLISLILESDKMTANQALRIASVINIYQKGQVLQLKNLLSSHGYDRSFSELAKLIRTLDLPKNCKYKAILGIGQSIEEMNKTSLKNHPKLKFAM